MTRQVGRLGSLRKEQPISGWWLAGGISPWSVAGVWQPKGATSQALSYRRLAGAEGNANVDPAVVGSGVAPAWDTADGWTANGTGWLNSGIIPINDQSYSFAVRFKNFDTTGLAASVLRVITASRARFGYGRGGTGTNFYNNGREAGEAFAPGANNSIIVAGANIYVGGVVRALTISAGSGTINHHLYFMARNIAGTANEIMWSGSIISVAIYNSVLTAAQALAVHNAMAAL
jgi:hypothetical protein